MMGMGRWVAASPCRLCVRAALRVVPRDPTPSARVREELRVDVRSEERADVRAEERCEAREDVVRELRGESSAAREPAVTRADLRTDSRLVALVPSGGSAPLI